MIAIMSSDFFDSLLAEAAQERKFLPGQSLFSPGDRILHLYLLMAGQVKLTRHSQHGDEVILHQSLPGSVIAEASLYAGTYHCDGIFETNSSVASLTINKARSILHDNPEIARQWSARLAEELQAARYRCELLSRKTVADRLAGWLEWHKTLPPKGQWKSLATQLGVSPEALYRTIKKHMPLDRS